MIRTFTSLREAVGHAAGSIARARLRKQAEFRGGPPPDEWTAVAVLAAMRSAGCPWDEPSGQAVLAWAKAPDDVGATVDPATRAALAAVLEMAGLVRPIRMMPVGYRVHDVNGRTVVCQVVDPDPRDPTIYRGTRAAAIASALAEGHVVPATQVAPRTAHDDARDHALGMLNAGASAADVDREIGALLHVTVSTARWWRRKWGLTRSYRRAG